MPITLVASAVLTNTATGIASPAALALTSFQGIGGSYVPQVGDFFVINTNCAATANRGAIGAGVGYHDTEFNTDNIMQVMTAAHTFIYSDDSNDTNMQVGYLFLQDTFYDLFYLPGTGAAGRSNAATVHVFRGVDPTTPLDVTPTTASGINTGVADCPSITPVTAGAWIVACGAAAIAVGASFTNPTGMDATANYFRSTFGNSTQDAVVGTALKTDWTSGAYNPAAFGGSTTTNTGSWGAVTLALRPYVPPTLTMNNATSLSQATSLTLTPHGVPLVVDSAASGGAVGGSDPGVDYLAGIGDFSSSAGWTLPAGYAITGGQMVITNAGGGFPEYTPITTAIPGRTYKLTYTITNYTDGSVRVNYGNVGTTFQSAVGTYSEDIVAAQAFSWARLFANTGSDLVIDNFKIQPYDALTLTFRISIGAANATSLSTTTSLTIAPKTTLIISPAVSASIASSLAFSTQLVLANATSLSTTGNVVLSPKTTLAPAAAVSASQTTSLTLTPHGVLLAPAAATSLSVTPNVTIAPKTTLGPAAAVSVSSTTSPTLQGIDINPANAISASQTTSPAVAPRFALTLQSSTSLSTAGTVALFYYVLVPAPLERTIGFPKSLLADRTIAPPKGIFSDRTGSPPKSLLTDRLAKPAA